MGYKPSHLYISTSDPAETRNNKKLSLYGQFGGQEVVCYLSWPIQMCVCKSRQSCWHAADRKAQNQPWFLLMFPGRAGGCPLQESCAVAPRAVWHPQLFLQVCLIALPDQVEATDLVVKFSARGGNNLFRFYTYSCSIRLLTTEIHRNHPQAQVLPERCTLISKKKTNTNQSNKQKKPPTTKNHHHEVVPKHYKS